MWEEKSILKSKQKWCKQAHCPCLQNYAMIMVYGMKLAYVQFARMARRGNQQTLSARPRAA